MLFAYDPHSIGSTFTFAPEPGDKTSWNAMLAASETQLLAAFFPDLEAKRLLDAMADATPSAGEKAAFTATRTQLGWDSSTTAWLSQHAPSLHARAAAWRRSVTARAP